MNEFVTVDVPVVLIESELPLSCKSRAIAAWVAWHTLPEDSVDPIRDTRKLFHWSEKSMMEVLSQWQSLGLN